MYIFVCVCVLLYVSFSSPSKKGTLIFLLLRYTPMKFNNTYVYPWWAYCIGWFLAMSSLVMIPLVMVCKVANGKGTLLQVNTVH